MTRTSTLVLCGLAGFAVSLGSASAEDACMRFPQGSIVQDPENLYSSDGRLEVDFTYQTSLGEDGKPRYCFVNSDGVQSPTLHVNPGDTLVINLTNLVPEDTGPMPSMPGMDMSRAGEGGCGALNMTSASVNMHWHGTNTPPICHQDEVIRTIINTGERFRYEVHFPKNEPPGLYWYHPHIHGLATTTVQGGATGAIIVEGIENVNPVVAGLPQRVIMIRDNQPANPPPRPTDDEATSDLSVNYIPTGGPQFIPAEYVMAPGEKQFWRIVNSAAVSILDLELRYDGKLQPFDVIALDGVALGSQDGNVKSMTVDHLLVPTAGRAEIVVTGPPSGVRDARFITHKVDTGPGGDVDPVRPLMHITTSKNAATQSKITRVPAVSGPPTPARFPGLGEAAVSKTRKLYFSEDDTFFYITVDGQEPRPYNMDDPPAIVTTQGTTEDWTIENRALENHEFHMHQIHFKLLARNGVKLPPEEQQILDTVDVPFWKGRGPYPSVTVRMDFRGPDVGDFVYHCHILDHEDNGMMAIIRVLPRAAGGKPTAKK